MKNILLLINLIFTISIYSQNDKEIEGAWVFKDVYQESGKESKNSERGKALLQTLNITFLADNKYTSQVVGITENGSWKIVDKAIHFTTEDGNSYTWPIIKLDDKELIVQRKTISVILEKK